MSDVIQGRAVDCKVNKIISGGAESSCRTLPDLIGCFLEQGANTY